LKDLRLNGPPFTKISSTYIVIFSSNEDETEDDTKKETELRGLLAPQSQSDEELDM
jgi:hypothetical protein